MGGLQMIDQFGRGQGDPVSGRCISNRNVIQLGRDGAWVKAALGAGHSQAAPAAAAVVESEALQLPRQIRTLGRDLGEGCG